MNLTFGTNIRISLRDESDDNGIEVTIAGLPAGVDLEKEDFMQGPDSEEPLFGEGRLLCKDGSFVTDGRPFTITFASGNAANAIAAAGVMAKHIIAPIRVKSISGSAGECLCTCMPAGLQLERAFNAALPLCRTNLSDEGMEGGFSSGEPLRVKVCLPADGFWLADVNGTAEALVSIAIADALLF